MIVTEEVNEGEEEVKEKRTKKPDRSWFRAQDGESCMRLATPPGGLTPGYHRLLGAAITASKKPPFTLLPQPPPSAPPRNPPDSLREDPRDASETLDFIPRDSQDRSLGKMEAFSENII